jgi:SAM dependent carboxyl methyltransferase
MPEPMASGGVYDHHSDYQLRGAISQVDRVESVAGELVPDEERGGLAIADYGCAQGRVTNMLIHRAVERIRAGHPDAPLSVYHNDLLTNDWATFVAHLQAEDSYLSIRGGPITPLISAISFYEPVAPRRIVDLGISFAAAQWLASAGPPDGGTALYFDQLEGRVRKEMAAQAHADWTRFLGLRADELVSGGRLIVNLMAIPDGGTAAGHQAWGRVRAICVELAAEGLLDPDHLDKYVIPIYERTVEELRRPFGEGIGERLELLEEHLAPVENPAAARYRQDGDAAAFARDFTGFFRAFSEPSLRTGLAAGDEAIEELYRRLGAQLEENAETFSFEVNALTVVMRRR